MIYIQLAVPERDFAKVRIKDISFFDNNGEDNLEKAFGFKYQVYKEDGVEIIPLKSKQMRITDQDLICSILGAKSTKLSAYDLICRHLLEYLVDNKIEIGTIELK